MLDNNVRLEREREKCNSPQCVDLAFYFSLLFHATCHPGQDPAPLWRTSTAILWHAFYFVQKSRLPYNLVAFFVLLAHLTPGTWSILTLGDTPTAMCLFTAPFCVESATDRFTVLAACNKHDSQWTEKEITPTWLL
jgi:hypothetical protein